MLKLARHFDYLSTNSVGQDVQCPNRHPFDRRIILNFIRVLFYNLNLNLYYFISDDDK